MPGDEEDQEEEAFTCDFQGMVMEIELQGVEQRVWRGFQVPGAITLNTLHAGVIQAGPHLIVPSCHQSYLGAFDTFAGDTVACSYMLFFLFLPYMLADMMP